MKFHYCSLDIKEGSSSKIAVPDFMIASSSIVIITIHYYITLENSPKKARTLPD